MKERIKIPLCFERMFIRVSKDVEHLNWETGDVLMAVQIESHTDDGELKLGLRIVNSRTVKAEMITYDDLAYILHENICTVIGIIKEDFDYYFDAVKYEKYCEFHGKLVKEHLLSIKDPLYDIRDYYDIGG